MIFFLPNNNISNQNIFKSTKNNKTVKCFKNHTFMSYSHLSKPNTNISSTIQHESSSVKKNHIYGNCVKFHFSFLAIYNLSWCKMSSPGTYTQSYVIHAYIYTRVTLKFDPISEGNKHMRKKNESEALFYQNKIFCLRNPATTHSGLQVFKSSNTQNKSKKWHTLIFLNIPISPPTFHFNIKQHNFDSSFFINYSIPLNKIRVNF